MAGPGLNLFESLSQPGDQVFGFSNSQLDRIGKRILKRR